MPKENRTRYALLGLLSLGPMSGYDIKKTIDGSLSNFWSESYGQIYPLLKNLRAEGLVTAGPQEGGGRTRRAHVLTPKGRKALRTWLDIPAEHAVGRIEVLLKLFFGRQAGPDTSARQVELFRELQRKLSSKYEAIDERLQSEHGGHTDLPYWRITLSYGRHLTRALEAWSEETLKVLKRLHTNEAAGPAPRRTSWTKRKER